jgi:hypothetical protein
MRDFLITKGVGKSVAAILIFYFVASFFTVVALLLDFIPLTQGYREKGYLVALLSSFASASIFYVRKTYIILFALGTPPTPPEGQQGSHNSAFIIYALIRPFFSVLVCFLFLLGVDHLIHSIVYEAVFSKGFLYFSAIASILLAAAIGPAIDMLPKIGKRSLSRLDGFS